MFRGYNKQLVRIEGISAFFNTTITPESSLGMNAIIQEAYISISKTDKKSFERDMSLIFYMHIVKHIEIAAYRTMRLTASKLGYDQAKTLLKENMDESKDNDRLFMLISKQYIS